MSSIFSTYSTGENRVTASFLAVLRSLSLGRIERLLGALLEQAEFELVTFENQPSKGAEGVPDAIIQSSCRILIETKTVRNAVRQPQLERHLKRLDTATETAVALLLLTPDDSRPPAVECLEDRRLAWASFAMLEQAIDEMLDDKHEVISEREAFLLRELQAMLVAEKLTGAENDVVVVAARNAWPEYNDFHAYVCQANRSLRAKRIAFYCKNNVYPLVPTILDAYEEVEMMRGSHQGELGKLVEMLLDRGLRTEGQRLKVVFLSPPDSPETITLPSPIPNDVKDKAGKKSAFTMGQRYTSLKALQSAKATSDLV
jgi:hypothetical protein